MLRLPPSYLRFITLWEALCAWYRDVEGESKDNKLQGWLGDKLAGWHSKKLSDDDYQARLRILKDVSPIGIMRGGEQVGEVLIKDESDFAQVVKAIYTVRCNLMKGGKPAESNDRETAVCDAASGVLDAIVQSLVFPQSTA
jgi:hypothetical protein